MTFKSPTTLTFWISVILAVLGLLGQVASIGVLSTFAFWLVLVAFILLAAGVLFKGL